MSESGLGERPLAESLSAGTRFLITLAVLAATLMEVLDTSIVNVALPHMQGELGATLDEIGWVATAYIVSNVVVLPLTGWLSDRFGRRRYLGYSVIFFTISSVGCGLSRSLGTLVLFRVLQGAGGAAFLSTAQATLIEVYPSQRQGFAQAMFGVGVVMAPTLGPSLGGFLTDRYSWPYIFFINLPVGILSAILTFLYVPDSRHANERTRADFVGIGLLVLALAPLQAVLERGQRENWFASNLICWLTVASVVGVLAFIGWELHPRNRSPAVDLRVLSNRNLAAGCVSGLCLGLVLYGPIFALPQFFQNLQDHSAEQTGVLLIPGGLATAISMPIVGQLVTRIDMRLLIGAGMCLVFTSMLMFASRFTAGSPDSAFFWPLILRGAGLGLQFVPLSLASLGTLPSRKVASGSGLYNLFRQLGGSFGIAALATMLDRRSRFHYDRLAESLPASGVLVQQRLAQYHAALAPHGIVSQQGRQSALKMLSGVVFQQAGLGAYQDLFLLSAYAAVASVAVLLLFRKPRVPQQVAAH